MLENILFNNKFYIKTFGCQMNVHDSDRMSRLLADEFGLTRTEQELEASLIILNTCAVREKAVHKVYSMIGALRKVFKSHQLSPIIGVCGCVAQVESKQLLKNNMVDFILGTDNIDSLPSVLLRLNNGESRLILNGFENKNVPYNIDTKIYSKKSKSNQKIQKRTAFVNIIKGCNNFCSFCIVPYTRGREKSRKIKDVISDVKNILTQGIIEICLLGQNVNSFGHDHGEKFSDLLFELGKIENLKRLRFTTSNPHDLSNDLIACFKPGTIPNLMPYFHFPIQAGNDAILERMKRQYTRQHYLNLVDKLRQTRPNIAISSDIIVGFPGETEEAFADTMKVIEDVKFDQVFSFVYSKRPKTPAAKMMDDVPLEVKKMRLAKLQKRITEIIYQKHKNLVGSTTVSFGGRTPENRIVRFDRDEELKDCMVRLEVIGATPALLKGKVISYDNLEIDNYD